LRAASVTADRLAVRTTLTYYQHAKQLFPKRLSRPDAPASRRGPQGKSTHAYPRCYVTRRIPVDEAGVPTGGAYYGPFASRRSAQAFAERVLDLFKVRRCQIKIRRDPTFPGCLYSEMKMCLAPASRAAQKRSTTSKFSGWCNSSKQAVARCAPPSKKREKASEQLDFGTRSRPHKKMEKLDEVLRGQPELRAAFRISTR